MSSTTEQVMAAEKKLIMKEKIHVNDLSYINKDFTINTNSYDITFPIANFNYRENTFEFATINWKVPKPSIALLFAMLFQAGQIANKFQSEVQFFILYNEDADRCEIFHPKQVISGANVSEWTYDDIPQGKRLLVDVHSHHTMGVDFSSTDDQSDKNLSLFCPHISIVLRSINNIDIRNLGNNISCRVTYSDGNIFLCKRVRYDDIFDMTSFALDMENLSFIKKKNVYRNFRDSIFDDEVYEFFDIQDEESYFRMLSKNSAMKKLNKRGKKKTTNKQKEILIDPEEKAQEEKAIDNVGE